MQCILKKTAIILVLFLLSACRNHGQLKYIAKLPELLHEVSGTELPINSNTIWMLNDSGNSPTLYGMNSKGKLIKQVKINAKNHDWEDLASDNQGNLYIGDFGNNANKRKNLAILKVSAGQLKEGNKAEVERIHFVYPDQNKFPPKKKKKRFDAESFFFFNDNFYIFTKSRIKDKFGKTYLYKVPAKRGNHTAIFINSFETCKDLECWITSADISNDGKKVVLINQRSAWLFTNFKGDDFFSGSAQEIPYKDDSTQKEGVCFRTDSTIYLTDEKAYGSGGNLYELKLKLKTN